ncbi:MAG: MBL fold metallo-hydrolase [Gammaproteobacteria bacterium]|nr:MBL fold metallo-hydrolase [Gammaproteobacteria bacterium]
MEIKTFYDTRTSTFTYVVFDPETKDAVIIDPVLDYDPVGSKIWTESVDEVIDYVKSKDLTLHLIMETHAHADHISGAQMIKEQYPEAQVAIGKNITVIQEYFKNMFNLDEDFPTDGSQFDRLLEDNEVVNAGSLQIKVIFTPGHTPACASYMIEDAIFMGDSFFMPDSGTGRCDFPAGSAHDLYNSITQRIYTLPDETRIFMGHDYQPGGREVMNIATVAEQKANNIHLKEGVTEEEFTAFRRERDSELAAPKLLFQSIQLNIDAGDLPDAEEGGKAYLKIPVNIFRPEPKGKLELEKV